MKKRKYIRLKHKKEQLGKRFNKYWYLLSGYYKGQDDGRLIRGKGEG